MEGKPFDNKNIYRKVVKTVTAVVELTDIKRLNESTQKANWACLKDKINSINTKNPEFLKSISRNLRALNVLDFSEDHAQVLTYLANRSTKKTPFVDVIYIAKHILELKDTELTEILYTAEIINKIFEVAGVYESVEKDRSGLPNVECLKLVRRRCKEVFSDLYFSETSAILLFLAHLISDKQKGNFARSILKDALMAIPDRHDTSVENEITRLIKMQFLTPVGKKAYTLTVNLLAPVAVSLDELAKIIGGIQAKMCRNKVTREFSPVITTYKAGEDQEVNLPKNDENDKEEKKMSMKQIPVGLSPTEFRVYEMIKGLFSGPERTARSEVLKKRLATSGIEGFKNVLARLEKKGVIKGGKYGQKKLVVGIEIVENPQLRDPEKRQAEDQTAYEILQALTGMEPGKIVARSKVKAELIVRLPWMTENQMTALIERLCDMKIIKKVEGQIGEYVILEAPELAPKPEEAKDNAPEVPPERGIPVTLPNQVAQVLNNIYFLEHTCGNIKTDLIAGITAVLEKANKDIAKLTSNSPAKV